MGIRIDLVNTFGHVNFNGNFVKYFREELVGPAKITIYQICDQFGQIDELGCKLDRIAV